MIILIENPDNIINLAVSDKNLIEKKIYKLFCPDCNPHCLNKFPTIGKNSCYICGSTLKPKFPDLIISHKFLSRTS